MKKLGVISGRVRTRSLESLDSVSSHHRSWSETPCGIALRMRCDDQAALGMISGCAESTNVLIVEKMKVAVMYLWFFSPSQS